MQQFQYYAIASPFIIVATIASFVMWNFMSTGEWKMRKRRLDPALIYQEQVASLYRQIREERQAHKAQMDELEQRRRRELQQQRNR